MTARKPKKAEHQDGRVTDGTEQEEVQLMLVESEMRFLNLINRLPFGVAITTPEGRLI